jgi:hypothetical protein
MSFLNNTFELDACTIHSALEQYSNRLALILNAGIATGKVQRPTSFINDSLEVSGIWLTLAHGIVRRLV